MHTCADYFLPHSTFFKGKVRSGTFDGCYYFSVSGFFKKTLVVCFGWVLLHQN